MYIKITCIYDLSDHLMIYIVIKLAIQCNSLWFPNIFSPVMMVLIINGFKYYTPLDTFLKTVIKCEASLSVSER